ncbi:MAG: protein kinase domain-containing protein [Planctomycetota bacterium]|jgi:serine/threonine-protein kinase
MDDENLNKTYSEYREKLWKYTTGSLPKKEKEFLKEHLARCESCRAMLEDVRDRPPEGAETLPLPGRIPLPRGFRLIEKIGSGGMGAVYKAHQSSMDREVAIKVLSSELAQKQEFVSRFLREAKAAAKLSHRNLVRVFDVGKNENGEFYYVMEFIKGKTLQKLIKLKKRISVEDVLDYIIQIASALMHAWEEKIIHRDIKPENIMIADEDDIAKLTDLGLAKQTDDAGAALTAYGVSMGTPDYMSPEQVRDTAGVDYRSDIYSLGVTFFHAITGRTPFDAKGAVETMALVVEGKWEWDTIEKRQIPKPVRAVIGKMMARKPSDRYETYEELIRALEKLHSTSRVPPPRRRSFSKKPPRRR